MRDIDWNGHVPIADGIQPVMGRCTACYKQAEINAEQVAMVDPWHWLCHDCIVLFDDAESFLRDAG